MTDVALVPSHIDEAWARELVGADTVVRAVTVAELDDRQGVLSRYEKSTEQAIVGHRIVTVRTATAGDERELRFVIKSKVPGHVTRRRLAETYRKFDARLAELASELDPSLLDDCHTRELAIYELDHPALRAISPRVWRVWRDDEREIYVVVMELLEGVRHARTLDDLDVWLASDVEQVLVQIARMHGSLLGTISGTAPPPYLLPFDRMNNAALAAYQAALLRYNAEAFPELYDPARTRAIEALLAAAPSRHRAILARPLTLVHGDFTPRNICLRPGGTTWQLCAYDWELALVHLPQRDVCELMCYTLDPRRGWRDVETRRLLERYRAALAEAAGRAIDADELHHDLALAHAELCTFKLLVQGITHQLLGNRYYFERLVHNAFDGLSAFGEGAR